MRKLGIKYKIEKFIVSKSKKLILFMVVLTILLLSVGYSAFSSSLNISKIAVDVRITNDIRVTGVSIKEGSNDALSNYEEYGVDFIESNVSLPSEDSTITYTVKVTNIGSAEMGILEITGLPDNLEIVDVVLKEKICNNNGECNLGITKEFDIKIKYVENKYDSTNTNYYIKLDFNFQPFYSVTYTDIAGEGYPREVLGTDTLVVDFKDNAPADVNVKIGDTEIIDYTYTNGVLSIPNVSGNVEIIAIQPIIPDIEIGDYIAYDCFTNVDSTLLTYTSTAENNGVSNQTATVSENPEWRVLSVEDDGTVLITTANPITGNISGYWAKNFALKGKIGHVNGVTELNNIANLYGNGQYALKENGVSTARHINLQDIDKMNEIDPTTLSGTTYGNTSVFTISSDGEILRNGVNNSANIKTVFIYYDGTTWVDLSETETKMVYITITDYNYTLKEDTVGQKMLKYNAGTTTKSDYWVATATVNTYPEAYARYQVKTVYKGSLTTKQGIGGHSYKTLAEDRAENDVYSGLRPVVTLRSGLTYTKDSNDVWQISE